MSDLNVVPLTSLAQDEHNANKGNPRGSTLMACETTGRYARLIELDPKYCDVIVRRWEKFTGKQAQRPGVVRGGAQESVPPETQEGA